MTDKLPCLFVSGYRQHGKDTVYHVLKNGIDFNRVYDIYLNEDAYLSKTSVFSYEPSQYKRVAFADNLKKELSRMFDINLQELDTLKEVKMSDEHIHKYPFSLDSSPVYRDAMINLGLHMRKEVGDHFWALAAAESTYIDHDEIPVVTDFRFPSEVKFAEYIERDIVTLRVHRKYASIPPLYDESEHSLDNYPFDIMLVPKGEELYKLNNNCSYFKIN